jgi:hypothetical protein
MVKSAGCAGRSACVGSVRRGAVLPSGRPAARFACVKPSGRRLRASARAGDVRRLARRAGELAMAVAPGGRRRGGGGGGPREAVEQGASARRGRLGIRSSGYKPTNDYNGNSHARFWFAKRLPGFRSGPPGYDQRDRREQPAAAELQGGTMSENSEREPAGVDTDADAADDPTGPDDAGSRKAEATPPIGTEGKPGQTQVDAPDDDVGGAEGHPDRTE